MFASLPDCSFENRVFVDGEAFPNPVSVCEECKCVSGTVDCHQAQCPHPRCNAPLPGSCCQNNCNGEEYTYLSGTEIDLTHYNLTVTENYSTLGCSYAGKEYPNGQEFPHPTDKCRTCSCIVRIMSIKACADHLWSTWGRFSFQSVLCALQNGNVQCLMKRCPPLSCSNPNVLPGDCCPQCPGKDVQDKLRGLRNNYSSGIHTVRVEGCMTAIQFGHLIWIVYQHGQQLEQQQLLTEVTENH